MNFIDIIIVLIIIWFAYRGLKNGLINELTGIVAIFLGIIMAIMFSKTVTDLFIKYNLSDSEYVPIISFTIILIVVIILTFIVSGIVAKFIKIIRLDWLNKIAGLVFGALKITLILSAVFFLINEFCSVILSKEPEITQSSVLYNPIAGLIEYLYPYINEIRQNSF